MAGIARSASPVRRSVVIFFSGVSLVIAIGATVIWVRSYYASDSIRYWFPAQEDHQRRVYIAWYAGQVHCGYGVFRFPPAQRSAYLDSLFGRPLPDLPRLMPDDYGLATSSTPWSESSAEYEEAKRNYGFPRFFVRRERHPTVHGYADETRLMVPFWAVVLPLLVVPVVSGWGVVRRRQRAACGCCGKCGYDLRASPERCPECGTAGRT
jgi:hypothetical protein